MLHARMSTDPPLDDLSWEPETYDAARVVARDRMMAAHGMHVYAAAARHRETGTAVGITTLVVFSDVPGFGDQWETIVLPEHRGHRLGALLKVANLRQAVQHEPAARGGAHLERRLQRPDAGGQRGDGLHAAARVGRVGARDVVRWARTPSVAGQPGERLAAAVHG